jgi:hypothetical protein
VGNPNPELHPENLRPIKPGEARNPNGSSRKQRLTSALINLIEERGLDEPLVRVGMTEAMKGDYRFWSYIFDRIDGKMQDKVDVTSKGESTGPLVILLPPKDLHADDQASAGTTDSVPGGDD